MCYSPDMPTPTTSIRIDPDSIYLARVAAVTARKPLGKWLAEAIREKIARETKTEKGKGSKNASSK